MDFLTKKMLYLQERHLLGFSMVLTAFGLRVSRYVHGRTRVAAMYVVLLHGINETANAALQAFFFF